MMAWYGWTSIVMQGLKISREIVKHKSCLVSIIIYLITAVPLQFGSIQEQNL